MTFTIGSSGNDVPDGTYTATLESAEILEGGFEGKEFRRWNFLLNVNGELTPLSGITSLNTGPKTKTYAWLSAITGRELKAGEQVDPIGTQCLVVVSRNRNGYATISDVKRYTPPQQVIDGVPR